MSEKRRQNRQKRKTFLRKLWYTLGGEKLISRTFYPDALCMQRIIYGLELERVDDDITSAKTTVEIDTTYVNIWKESQSNPESPIASNVNINVQNFQHAANLDGYRDADGNPLKEDGKDGPKTQYVRKQINLKAKWTVLGYKVGSTGHVVEWYQGRCNEILGHDQKEDGKYGKNSRTETLALQNKLNLKCDGIAGYNNTIQMAFYN